MLSTIAAHDHPAAFNVAVGPRNSPLLITTTDGSCCAVDPVTLRPLWEHHVYFPLFQGAVVQRTLPAAKASHDGTAQLVGLLPGLDPEYMAGAAVVAPSKSTATAVDDPGHVSPSSKSTATEVDDPGHVSPSSKSTATAVDNPGHVSPPDTSPTEGPMTELDPLDSDGAAAADSQSADSAGVVLEPSASLKPPASSSPEPMQAAASEIQQQTGDCPTPVEIDRGSAPVETNRDTAPVETDRDSAPVETDRQPAPVETDDYLLAACAWDGTTFFFDTLGNHVQFALHHEVACFQVRSVCFPH